MPSPVNKTQSVLTIPYRVIIASDQINDIQDVSANLYVGIGKGTVWPGGDTNIPAPTQSIDGKNQLRRDLVALKKVFISEAALVVPRVDWVSNTKYDNFVETVDMYATSTTTNANGTVNVATGNNQVIGTNTTFAFDYSNNELITIPGDNIFVLPQTREIINVASNTLIIVNAAFTATCVANVPELTVSTAPNYSKKFYVRNTYDQVFLCLDNNFGAVSNDMPKISLGGQLPSNPYILTADGMKWKYLYTIAGGPKQSFFTAQWMPVYTDTTVDLAATNGRLDIIKIFNGGTGYNNGAASFSAPIIVVTGDGSGANVTAQVDANGTINGLNILNGGSGYTVANITANVGSGGVNANLVAVIGPQGGWGSNAALELGATTMMISVGLTDTENSTIPTTDTLGDNFEYRQISLFREPFLANGDLATSLNYDATSYLTVSDPSARFVMGDTVYQNLNPPYDLANATFTATVVQYINSSQQLHINNMNGTFIPRQTLYDANGSLIAVQAYTLTASLVNIFSGNLLYIENRAPVTRSPGQTENIKLILQF